MEILKVGQMKNQFLKIFLLSGLLFAYKVNLAQLAQQDVWDVLATELMISHNKKNYADHEQVTTNQVVSQSTVSVWKSTTNQFKTLSDLLDRRLTSAFIIAADVTTLYNIYAQLSEMIAYEGKALNIARKHPWLTPVLIKEQNKILQSSTDLFDYLSLVVLSYGDISKMKASARKVIFREIDMQIGVLKGRCYSLYLMMKRFDITSQIRNTKGGQFINKDAQIVKDILKNIK